MIATCVYVKVKPAYIDEFIAATIKNHEASIQEKGNLRFDFVQDEVNPTKFMLYEVFKTEEAVQAHKKTAHYLEWRETVKDWMAEPRSGIRHVVIAPTDLNLW